jgi:DNA-binding NtrC family response regulator
MLTTRKSGGEEGEAARSTLPAVAGSSNPCNAGSSRSVAPYAAPRLPSDASGEAARLSGQLSSGGRLKGEAPETQAEAGADPRGDMQAPPTSPNLDLSALHLLIVDDDDSLRNACSEIARLMGLIVHGADSVPTARIALQQQPIDLLLLDMKLPGGGGLVLLEEVKALHPETAVVVMTAYATVSSAVEAMRIGAADYLTKPFALEELKVMLGRAARRRQFDQESRLLREKLRNQTGEGHIIGNSPEMEKLYRILSKVAFSSHPVLILGESGTGKEMVARTIHFHGPNAAKPFVAVDCAALVPTLIESELFGHVKGAFTGANRAKEGLLATAEGGTVFLDEIGELPLDLQSKLLRALQEKEVRPVGANHAVPISARVLRERRGDIPMLAAHFLERLERESGRHHIFADESLRLMQEYDWPGNVRELENAIERACALASGPVLYLNDLPSQLQDFRMQAFQTIQTVNAVAASELAQRKTDTALTQLGSDAIVSIAELEKQAILNTIRQLNGDKLMAARLLQIGKTTLYRKLKEYGISEQLAEGVPDGVEEMN